MATLRYIIYFVGLASITGILTQLEAAFPGALQMQTFAEGAMPRGVMEYSPLQVIQLGMLLCCLLLLATVARDCPSQRPIAFLFGGIALAFLIRELKYFLDSAIGTNFWQVVLAVALALVIVYTYRHQRRFLIAWGRIWPSPGISFLFIGLLIVVVFARLVGHEPLWQSILGDAYLRLAKRAVEEFMQFMGYSIWLIGTIEFTIQAHVIARREPQPAAAKRRARRRGSTRGQF